MYYLGVDGGGSSTRVVLADARSGVALTRRFGPGNVAVLGRPALVSLLQKIVEELLPAGKIGELRHATFALAGTGRAGENEVARDVISAAGIGAYSLLTDVEMLHFSAFGHTAGLMLSAGTGSVCLIGGGDKPYRQMGGWGYLLGDEGSGFDLGRQGIREALREAEARAPLSRMSKGLLDLFGTASIPELLSCVYEAANPQSLVASAGRLVLQMAGLGEKKAEKIVDAAAVALIELARRGFEELGDAGGRRMSLYGGVLQPGSFLRERFCRLAQTAGLEFELVRPEMTPAAAAVVYSFEQSGEVVPPKLLQDLKGISD